VFLTLEADPLDIFETDCPADVIFRPALVQARFRLNVPGLAFFLLRDIGFLFASLLYSGFADRFLEEFCLSRLVCEAFVVFFPTPRSRRAE